MFEIITLDRLVYWDKIVKSFSQYDIYYLSGYVKAFEIHGDGIPLLLYYQKDNLRGISVMMKRDISSDNHFNGLLPEDSLYDIVTPYGYGGFIFEGNTSTENIIEFDRLFAELLNSKNIISVFYRFHPQLNNADVLRSVIDVIDLGKTVEIDLQSMETIWSDFTSKNRNTIRKSEKKGVVIKNGQDKALFDQFIEIYNHTMDNDNADLYYYFDENFYKSIQSYLQDNYEMFYAEFDGKIIAMSIILFANKRMHYHLSGQVFEYRNFAATNLLLYKAACWGVEKGFKKFHLGGGVGSGEDGLFKFKKAFNRYKYNQFSIGKKIYNQEKYDFLVSLRNRNDLNFDINSSFFPLYRA